jgi:hypothetical protein
LLSIVDIGSTGGRTAQDDVLAIEKVLYQYCRGIDRCDIQLISGAYHDDSFDDHGNFTGSGKEFSAWVVERLLRMPQRTTHVLTNILPDIDGDVATVESYYIGTHFFYETAEIVQFHGRYVDRFERRSGRWAISRRQVVHDWSERRTVVPVHREDDERFVRGVRGTDDAAYWSGALPPS